MTQIAIVTGAGRGIGAATAKLLAEQGLSVAVLDLNLENAHQTATEITDAGGGPRPAMRCGPP